MPVKSLVKAVLCLFLLAGCTSQQWVKDYVGQETTSVKSELRERLQPMEQAAVDNKEQIDVLRKELANMDSKIGIFTARVDDFSKSLEEVSKSSHDGIIGLRKDVSEEVKALDEKVKDLNTKLQKLGMGLAAFQKGIEALERRLQEMGKAPTP